MRCDAMQTIVRTIYIAKEARGSVATERLVSPIGVQRFVEVVVQLELEQVFHVCGEVHRSIIQLLVGLIECVCERVLARRKQTTSGLESGDQRLDLELFILNVDGKSARKARVLARIVEFDLGKESHCRMAEHAGVELQSTHDAAERERIDSFAA